MENNLLRIHEVDIYVNNKLVDVFDTTVLRFNNQFVDPTKIETISAEYTFSFKLPESRRNVEIFGFANVLSRRGKFNKHYPTSVNIDGIAVFEGDLILQGYSKSEGFDCNLYVNKLNTVEKIFGDSVLSDITDWEMDYKAEQTINAYNKGTINYYTRDCCFPLISYGMFQKLPNDDGTYQSKHIITKDKNRFYLESFYPTMNLLKTVEKCFNHKGYKLAGDIFDDSILRKIYMTTTLSDKQDPMFNLGGELGESEVSFIWHNTNGLSTSGQCTAIAPHMIQTLEEPMWGVGNIVLNEEALLEQKNIAYNFEKINVYDMWSSSQDFTTIVDVKNRYLWRQNRFVAPNDGFYEIELYLTGSFAAGNTSYPQYFNVMKKDVAEFGNAVSLASSLYNYPMEFQLVKNNSDGNVGLICPKSLDAAFSLSKGTNGVSLIADDASTRISGYTSYPHEKANYIIGTEYGYRPQLYSEVNSKAMMDYDPRVNENFVMGTCIAFPHCYNSVIKNGRSWDATCDKENQSRYNNNRYKQVSVIKNSILGGSGMNVQNAPNSYAVNYLQNATNSLTVNSNSFTANVKAIVYLNKNDYLQLKCVQRRGINAKEYDDYDSTGLEYKPFSYLTDAAIGVSGRVKFRAYAPKDTSFYTPTSRDSKSSADTFSYGSESKFPKKLDLSQFLSNEEKMSDFVNNFIKEFNLSYSQNGDTITLNKQKIKTNKNNVVVNLDDRVAESEISTEVIDFPSQMSVEYTIDLEERGVYITAEENTKGTNKMEQPNWTDYADKGYDIIHIIDDEYADESKVQTKTSYCWYEPFYFDASGLGFGHKVMLPVQAKDEWMIEGYKYGEMMKKDGYGMTRRYFFPDKLDNQAKVYLFGDTQRVPIPTLLCTNTINNIDLSYKSRDKETLLTRYFNPYYSNDGNYIKFNCYLTPEEYVAIKNGSNIQIDDDIYNVVNIQGFDPSGMNTCEITAMQRFITNITGELNESTEGGDITYDDFEPEQKEKTYTFEFDGNVASEYNVSYSGFNSPLINIISFYDNQTVNYTPTYDSDVVTLTKQVDGRWKFTVKPNDGDERTTEIKFVQATSNNELVLTINQSAVNVVPENPTVTYGIVQLSTGTDGETVEFENGEIPNEYFKNRTDITMASITTSILKIGANAFQGCTNLLNITYGGTKAEFQTVIGDNCLGTPNEQVSCLRVKDGDILDRETYKTSCWTEGMPPNVFDA